MTFQDRIAKMLEDCKCGHCADCELAQLRAEVARYREALEDIVHMIYGNEVTLPWIERKARAALEGDHAPSADEI